MSPIVDDSKVFKPFLPSLTHLALVQVTIPLFNAFGDKLLSEAEKGIELEKSAKSNESSRENCDENYKKAKEILKKLPRLLRLAVCDTSVSLRFEVHDWEHGHPGFEDVECIFQWKCCGTIDRIKTAEQFVQNGNNNIRKRFEMACMYCMKESILALWEEIEVRGDAEHFNVADESPVGDAEHFDGADESPVGDAEHFDGTDESIVSFWVRWIRDGSLVPWTQALMEVQSEEVFIELKSYSSFFPLLQPEERRVLLHHFFVYTEWEDLRLCLYSLTKDEEELLLQREPVGVFILYLDWPLRSLFLETAEKVFKYMDGSMFKTVVIFMLNCTINASFPDDVEIFQGLWDISPDRLKDFIKACPDLFRDIEDLFLRNKKEMTEADELTNTIEVKPDFIVI